jgi:hypothetical protein
VEEEKESQRIRAEFMDFLDRVDPVRGQIFQPEVEDTPGRRVPRVGKKNRRKRKREECGWAAGYLGRLAWAACFIRRAGAARAPVAAGPVRSAGPFFLLFFFEFN